MLLSWKARGQGHPKSRKYKIWLKRLRKHKVCDLKWKNSAQKCYVKSSVSKKETAHVGVGIDPFHLNVHNLCTYSIDWINIPNPNPASVIISHLTGLPSHKGFRFSHLIYGHSVSLILWPEGHSGMLFIKAQGCSKCLQVQFHLKCVQVPLYYVYKSIGSVTDRNVSTWRSQVTFDLKRFLGL